MIINGTSIRGIYLYSSDAEFEAGDFVISGNSIYLCTANDPTSGTIVQGIDPSEDTNNFTIYLGDKTVTADEYYNYINGEEVEDKYVSSLVLYKILNSYGTGLPDRTSGEITDLIDTEEELNELLIDSDMNYSISMVSRSIFEDLGLTVYDSDSVNRVLVKQYTYYNTEGVKTRVQEAIDFEKGIAMYRYAVESGDTFNSSYWKSSSSDLTTKGIIENLSSRLQNMIEEYDNMINTLSGRFCFCKVLGLSSSSRTTSITLQCSDSSANFYVESNGESFNNDAGNVVSISLRDSSSTTYAISSSLDIDLTDVFTNGTMIFSIFSGNTVTVSKESDSSIKLTTSGNVVFTDIYYKKTYSNE